MEIRKRYRPKWGSYYTLFKLST